MIVTLCRGNKGRRFLEDRIEFWIETNITKLFFLFVISNEMEFEREREREIEVMNFQV